MIPKQHIFFCILACILLGCASVPLRKYDDDKMKLAPDETEYVALWNIDDYISSIMENVKGYAEPVVEASESASDLLVWMYVGISGLCFIGAIVFFAIASLTHMYKCNVVGFILLIGAGVSAGFAELADFWWTIPVAGIIGLLIWMFTHKTKHFSLWKTIKDYWSKKKNGNH